MNTASSIFLVLVIAAFLAYDGMVRDWTMSLFLAREFEELLSWMAFWR